MLINAQFSEGQKVYHRGDAENSTGIVTGFNVRGQNVMYFVTWGNCNETVHYGYELTTDKTYG